MRRCQRRVPPPHSEKIQKNSSFSQATFPNHRNNFDQMTVALIILDFLGLRIELGGSVKRCLTGWQQFFAKMMTLILIMCVHHKYSLLNLNGNVLSPGVKSSQDNTGEDHDNHKYDDHIDSMRI